MDLLNKARVSTKLTFLGDCIDLFTEVPSRLEYFKILKLLSFPHTLNFEH